MKILIAGGSGFLGRALADQLALDGHEIVILSRRGGSPAPQAGATRSVAPIRLSWSPDGTAGPWAAALDGVDAVINLAGESIAAHRWSPAQKAAIRDSRVLAARSLVAAIKGATSPPRMFISGSAQGYYGSRGDEVLTEESPPGHDFLAGVCTASERAALEARPFAERVVLVRTGLVLDRREGALPQMVRPFRLFAGGPVGSGRQYVSWIHRDDWVSLIQWALGNRAVDGPLNATAPNPVRNVDFARAIGRVLGRPSMVKAPAFALTLAVGEMAEALLLSSQRVVPARALALGFTFRFPDLDEALRNALAG
jgi:uncharacterized protein